MKPSEINNGLQQNPFIRRVLIVVTVTAIAVVLLLGVAATFEVLLLFFLSILFAIVLRSLTHWLYSHTPLSEKWALLTVVIAILIGTLSTIVFLGPRIADQIDKLAQTLPQSWQQLETQLQQYRWGQQILDEIPTISTLTEQVMGSSGGIFARITGVFSATLGTIANIAVVVFTGLFLAAEPQTYVQNALRLVPKPYRSRAFEVLTAIADTLRKWLASRFISMTVVAVLTTVGLSLIGMPLALSLGLTAGLLSFIPTFGPILALVPGVLLGLLESPAQALTVVLLYTTVQMIDNYLVTPVVVRSTVNLPPALMIISQILFGILAGRLGLVLAAPVVAVLVVIVRMLYVEDILNDREAG